MIPESLVIGLSLIFPIFYIAVLVLTITKQEYKSKTSPSKRGTLALWLHWIPSAILVLTIYTFYILKNQLYTNFIQLPITGLVLLSLGILLYFYSHVYLAKNWSATVSLNKAHTLTQTGPYKLVRNPMYSALLLTTLSLTFLFGNWLFLLAFIYELICFVTVIKSEEQILNTRFPNYQEYKSKTKMLIPFIL